MRAFCFSELPHHLKLPTIHSGGWDPVFDGVQRHRRDAVHAHRFVVDEPGRVARRARRRRRHARVQQLDGVARRLVVLGQAHRVPEAEARVLRRPDRLDPLRARAGRHGVGAARQLAALEGAHPRAAVDLLLRPHLRLLHRRLPRPALAAPRSARTTSASRPTTRTPTPRGRRRRSTPRRCSPTSTTRSRTRCCAATRSRCSSSTASDEAVSSRGNASRTARPVRGRRPANRTRDTRIPAFSHVVDVRRDRVEIVLERQRRRPRDLGRVAAGRLGHARSGAATSSVIDSGVPHECHTSA